MAKRRAEDDENEAPVAKARKSSQASTSKQAKQGLEGKQVGIVRRAQFIQCSIRFAES